MNHWLKGHFLDGEIPEQITVQRAQREGPHFSFHLFFLLKTFFFTKVRWVKKREKKKVEWKIVKTTTQSLDRKNSRRVVRERFPQLALIMFWLLPYLLSFFFSVRFKLRFPQYLRTMSENGSQCKLSFFFTILLSHLNSGTFSKFHKSASCFCSTWIAH